MAERGRVSEVRIPIVDEISEVRIPIVDEIVKSFESMMEDAPFTSDRSSIFKVPETVSRHNEKSYSPIAFSIGPFHHAKQHLRAAERIKLNYMTDLLNRQPKLAVKHFINAVAAVRNEARECYAGRIDMISEDEFLRVMVLDGCFILELFFKRAYDEEIKDGKGNDPIFSTHFMLEFLFHDLILVENQIPWLILELLLNLTIKNEKHEYYLKQKPLLQLAMEFFGKIFSTTPPSIHKILSNHERVHGFHILDLLRKSLLIYVPHSQPRKYEQWQFLPSATNLHEAGIKLKVRTDYEGILDIKFHDGVLEIPPLVVQDSTETLFRNLILLEQTCLFYTSRFTSYAALWENLVETSNDLKLLCERNIIETSMNIEDATLCFRKLIHGIYLKENFYFDITVRVNQSCRRRWPRYLRVLKVEYFKTPWAIISIIAAGVLLVLSFLQTLFTVVHV